MPKYDYNEISGKIQLGASKPARVRYTKIGIGSVALRGARANVAVAAVLPGDVVCIVGLVLIPLSAAVLAAQHLHGEPIIPNTAETHTQIRC